MRAAEQLCSQCGLCCNGVLFGDVELQAGDKTDQLTSLGLDIFRKGRKQAFNQPCKCLQGDLCRIYTKRPKQCRAFECMQLRLVEQGAKPLSAAQRKILEAKKLAGDVAQLCRDLGHQDETVPLNRRYAAVMSEPMDLAGDERGVEMRGELMLAVGKLVEVIERDFLRLEGRD